jgi:hypothetical protein
MFTLLLATVLINTPLVPPTVKDVQSLSDYMRKEFTYKAEPKGEDYWQTPEETTKLKSFDCEDASFFSEKILKSLGYQDVQAIAIYGKQNGEKYFHAITIFKTKNGKYQYFSNMFYSYFRDFESVTEIINFECPLWAWYGKIERPHKFVDKHIQTN